MKNFDEKKGFKNRHSNKLPSEKKIIEILIDNEIKLCWWCPFDKNDYDKDNMPSKGYLGTARVINDQKSLYKSIGYHAWEQNDYEFIYYREINYENYEK